MGDWLIAFNNSGDGAAAAGRQLGTEYVLPGGITAHGTGSLRTILQQAKSERPRGKATNWARVKLFQGGAVAIVSNNVSHMGSTAGRGKVPRGYSYNSGQDGLFVSASPLAETQFFVVEGDAATHLADHGSYGSISSPNGQRIFSVNNAGVSRTVVEKQFTLPAGQRNFSFSTNADFVTTEFPEFVGSQFDDKGRITLITPAGKSFQLNTIFSESVNSSNFTPVSNLPSPLRKGDGAGAPTGGHTGFQNVGVNSLPVSPGGTVTLRLEVENVGDQLYPSSVLINNSQAR